MKITRRSFASAIALLFLLLFVPSTSQARKSASQSYLMYVGTYTGPQSKGIYAYRFDSATGQATPVGLVAETVNPSFLATDPSQRFLYAVNEVSDYQGKKTGAVSAFAIDRKSGKLTFLNEVPSHGAGPCYVSLDQTGQYALVANYDGGSVAVFPLLKDGRLGEASSVIEHTGPTVDPLGAEPHQIDLSRDNRFAVASYLGLDQLLVYRFDAAKGTLAANDPPFAQLHHDARPRHFAFRPNYKFLYLLEEADSKLDTFSYDATVGTLRQVATVSTLPAGLAIDNTTAEIKIRPDGKFLYSSNRGHDSIAVFALEPKTGMPSLLQAVPSGGKKPRNFEIDPAGSYLVAANQNSNNVVVFKIDQQTGQLTPTGQVLEVRSPVCIKFVKIK
ncbi:MAG: lactonase family protein [Terriglobales bacterium]